jgi:ADP-ribosylglycohydrolase
MLGAIAGDIIGSPYEFDAYKSETFPLFKARGKSKGEPRATDDSVLTVATARALLSGEGFAEAYRSIGRLYLGSGFGGMFVQWLQNSEGKPYNSYGNGSAMRVSPVAFAYDTEEEVLEWARRTSEVTHDHPEGVKGAQAVALAIWMARNALPKKTIASVITSEFGYDLSKTVEEIRKDYAFDETCQGSVPQAIRCFLESSSFEDAVRKAVSLGGDADTQACIAGSIAHPYYGVPADIAEQVEQRLDPFLSDIIAKFCDAHSFGWEKSGDPVRKFTPYVKPSK